MNLKVLTNSKNEFIIFLYKRIVYKKSEVVKLSNNIKKIRKMENKTQIELAKYLKITQQAVSYMENNDVNLPMKTMKKIAKFLNRTVPEVFPEMKLTV